MDKKSKMKKRLQSTAVFLIMLILVVVLIGIYKSKEKVKLVDREGVEYVKGKVLETDNSGIEMTDTGYYAGVQYIQVEILEGNYKGQVMEIEHRLTYTYSVFCKPGMTVICNINVSGDYVLTYVYNYYRSPVLYGLVFLFCAILSLIGGIKGVKTVISLGFTLLCVLFMFIPMIYHGVSPFLAAVLAAAMTTIFTLFLLNGWSYKTFSSVVGTIMGVTISGLSAAIFGKLAHLDGYAMAGKDDLILIRQNTGLGIGELLFAGILIASLGAVMDVGMSISSSISEIQANSPGISPRKLFLSGMNVGKDMMGTMSNTLILAFVGGAINTLLAIYASQFEYSQIMNSNEIGVEILQGMAGSLGVILTVPITSYISSYIIPMLTSKRKKL